MRFRETSLVFATALSVAATSCSLGAEQNMAPNKPTSTTVEDQDQPYYPGGESLDPVLGLVCEASVEAYQGVPPYGVPAIVDIYGQPELNSVEPGEVYGAAGVIAGIVMSSNGPYSGAVDDLYMSVVDLANVVTHAEGITSSGQNLPADAIREINEAIGYERGVLADLIINFCFRGNQPPQAKDGAPLDGERYPKDGANDFGLETA